MFLLGYILGGSIIEFKAFERTVSVKGLAEQEVQADIVLWPIQYIYADNDLSGLYAKLEKDTTKIEIFLKDIGFKTSEMSLSAPSVTDKMAQGYGGVEQVKYRYSAVQTLTLYTSNVEKARKAMTSIAALGKTGITFRSNSYENQTEYIYTKLNDIKPAMIEEATRNARTAALKFAEDSQSSLGKIKSARQGQFSIVSRDKFTPHIKKVRVVSTIEYYLND
jgi:hypothetical protein